MNQANYNQNQLNTHNLISIVRKNNKMHKKKKSNP